MKDFAIAFLVFVLSLTSARLAAQSSQPLKPLPPSSSSVKQTPLPPNPSLRPAATATPPRPLSPSVATPVPSIRPVSTAPTSPTPIASAAPDLKTEDLKAFTESKDDQTPEDDQQFRKKLSELLSRTEKSIKLLREQIAVSQTAPFLPDLYLQLAELLTQRSTTLYYIQMERMKDSPSNLAPEQQFSPVVVAEQEAIDVYRTIIRDFPDFPKRRDVMFRLATGLKSIDESVEFIKVSSDLIKSYPDSEEAMKCRLLLGQHYFDQQAYSDARDLLNPVAQSKLVYESDLAKYRLGLIDIAEDKSPDALHEFEQVIQDDRLKIQDNPYNLSLKRKVTKTDLKREALIDSIRAYTQVFQNNPDPVTYYSKLAPTEIYFQEVIEKLALRYITLKRYDTALKLLRTLTERIVEPQKVIQIYQEVLMQIPPEKRSDISVEEMQFVLSKYNMWISFYKVPKDTYAKSYYFFEKQIRDLGTRAHEAAKVEANPQTKTQWLERARDFYALYLGFFDRSENAVRMATDLADVYYSLGDYRKSGDYYLRIFSGEFGRPTGKDLLIENAILVLQKKGTFSFYDTVRTKGLLIKALQDYLVFSTKARSDPKTNLLLVKTEYEQGFVPEALQNIFAFVHKFSNFPEAIDGAELVLDYYNTRNDFNGLETTADRLLGMRLPNATFNQKLLTVKRQAKARVVQEQLKASGEFDEFAQGKSYLKIALMSQDTGLLEEALAKSKQERDSDTFFRTAAFMAAKEKNPDKKTEIQKSLAHEFQKMTKYYKSLSVLEEIVNDSTRAPKARVAALDEAMSLALVLRDWTELNRYVSDPMWIETSTSTKTRLKEQLVDLLDSPAPISLNLASALNSLDQSNETLYSFFKAQFKLDSAINSRTRSEISKRCASNPKLIFCTWDQMQKVDAHKQSVLDTLAKAPTTPQSVEPTGKDFMALSSQYQALEGTGDPQLEIALSLREMEIYRAFSKYLSRVSAANPEFRSVLDAKAKESADNANLYLQKCRAVQQSNNLLQPGGRLCKAERAPSLQEVLSWNLRMPAPPPAQDPVSNRIEPLAKTQFFTPSADAMLDLAKAYLDEGDFHHSTAASTYGMSLYKDREKDFRAIMGCSVLSLGFLNEATYHLKNANDYENLRTKCQKTLDGVKTSL